MPAILPAIRLIGTELSQTSVEHVTSVIGAFCMGSTVMSTFSECGLRVSGALHPTWNVDRTMFTEAVLKEFVGAAPALLHRHVRTETVVISRDGLPPAVARTIAITLYASEEPRNRQRAFIRFSGLPRTGRSYSRGRITRPRGPSESRRIARIGRGDGDQSEETQQSRNSSAIHSLLPNSIARQTPFPTRRYTIGNLTRNQKPLRSEYNGNAHETQILLSDYRVHAGTGTRSDRPYRHRFSPYCLRASSL